MFWQYVIEKKTRKRAVKVASVVGTILVLINQWQAVFGEDKLDLIKLMLTYMVPYCVSSYSTARALLEYNKADVTE